MYVELLCGKPPRIIGDHITGIPGVIRFIGQKERTTALADWRTTQGRPVQKDVHYSGYSIYSDLEPSCTVSD